MALDCPRCHEVQLQEIEVGKVLLDRCPRCAGIWFDHDEVGGIIGRRDGIKKLESIVPPPEREIPSMSCPRCPDVSLRELKYREVADREIIAYRCVSCAGTWIDRGALREAEDPQLAKTLEHYFAAAFADK